MPTTYTASATIFANILCEELALLTGHSIYVDHGQTDDGQEHYIGLCVEGEPGASRDRSGPLVTLVTGPRLLGAWAVLDADGSPVVEDVNLGPALAAARASAQRSVEALDAE